MSTLMPAPVATMPFPLTVQSTTLQHWPVWMPIVLQPTTVQFRIWQRSKVRMPASLLSTRQLVTCPVEFAKKFSAIPGAEPVPMLCTLVTEQPVTSRLERMPGVTLVELKVAFKTLQLTQLKTLKQVEVSAPAPA